MRVVLASETVVATVSSFERSHGEGPQITHLPDCVIQAGIYTDNKSIKNMKTSGKTVLIIGGSAGIGFELAKTFSENGNEVIITGRSEARLVDAASQVKNTTPIVSDFTNAIEMNSLLNKIKTDFPNVNVLINNAALAMVYSIVDDSDGSTGYEKAWDEMHTNYFSVARLTETMLPVLRKQNEAAIVNVTSIAAFLPAVWLDTQPAKQLCVLTHLA